MLEGSLIYFVSFDQCLTPSRCSVILDEKSIISIEVDLENIDFKKCLEEESIRLGKSLEGGNKGQGKTKDNSDFQFGKA